MGAGKRDFQRDESIRRVIKATSSDRSETVNGQSIKGKGFHSESLFVFGGEHVIREMRLEKNYSQYEIAYMLGLNIRQLSARESGASPWTFEELSKLADLFHMSIGNLYYIINNGDTRERTDLAIDNREELKR